MGVSGAYAGPGIYPIDRSRPLQRLSVEARRVPRRPVPNTKGAGKQSPPRSRFAAELRQLRTYFPDGYFGELIFLVKEGVLIVPSHMGERPIRAMHGYHPSDPNSDAIFLSKCPPPRPTETIADVYRCLEQAAVER